jgi:hypothetical protein
MEAHIIEDLKIHPKTNDYVKLIFKTYLREEKKFNSIDELKNQIKLDIQKALEVLMKVLIYRFLRPCPDFLISKLNIILVLVLALFFCSYAEVKVPEVVFPLEITTKITEEKPYLEPPNTLELKTLNEELDITQYIKPKKPTDVKLPVLTIEKPTAYLGIPPSNALLSDAIDYYNKGDLLFAESSLEKFIEKYKDHKNMFYAYYLLGVVKYNLGKVPRGRK